MKTVAEWNAQKKAEYRPPVWEHHPEPKPEPIGAACPCGAELHTEPGTFYGMRGPFGSGIQCLKCGQRGYIMEWMGPAEITLVKKEEGAK